MKRAKWVFIIGVLLLSLMGLFSRWHGTNRMPLLTNAQAMRQEIVKRIPIGSGINQAQRTMQTNGFDCQRMKNTAFSEDDPGHGGQKVHAPADFLYCDQSHWAGLFIVERWQVAIVDKHGRVSNVYVSVGLTGP